MPTLRTNLLRIQVNNPALQYQIEIYTKITIEIQHIEEIESYFYSILPNIIYAHPYIYSKAQINNLNYQIYLSNGQCFDLKLKLIRNDIKSHSIIDAISIKLIKKSELLYSSELEYCMNPYQQIKIGQFVLMPAYTIKPKEIQQHLCLCLVPMFVFFNPKEQISQKSNILLDYYSGNFYRRQKIVRFDKEKGEIHFRNNQILLKQGLHPITLKIMNGFQLSSYLYLFFDRIKQTSKDFTQLWQIKFDNYFLQNQYQYVNPGSIIFRNNFEKSIAEKVTSMNEYSWIQKIKSFYSNVCFDEIMSGKIVFLYCLQMQTIIKQFTKHLEAINYRMGNNIIYSNYSYVDFSFLDQIYNCITKNKLQNKGNLVYFIPYKTNQNKIQRENLQKIIQFLIDHKSIFHLVQIQPNKQIDFQAQFYRHLSLIYAKLRMNPWKIKSIPFTNKPMVVMTMDVSLNRDNMLSISLISTMNLFLSKFTSTYKKCSKEDLLEAIELSIKQCIEKFKLAHKIYPSRIFLIRNGITSNKVIDEFSYIRSSIQAFNGSKITYVTLSVDHYLRTFTQLDSNYVSKDNVKKIQLLAYTKINKQIYYQLQLQNPMHLVQIYQIGEQDPNFTQNILELLGKIVFGSVGNSYGKGLGFIDYSKKLNEFKQFNLNSWSQILKQGYITFI